jgi:acetoin utilization protein AcuB
MKASKIMKQKGIQYLPVLSKGRLVGIVSDRDLKEATPSKATTLDIHEMYYLLDKVTVKSLMPKHLYTIAPGDTVEKAAAVMLKHHISALPVVDDKGALAGIITKGDIFRAFVSISGIHQGALAMSFELPDQPGSIQKVTDVVRAHGGRIASILTGYEGVPEGFRHVFIRAKQVQDEKTLKQELESKYKVLYFIHEKVD